MEDAIRRPGRRALPFVMDCHPTASRAAKDQGGHWKFDDAPAAPFRPRSARRSKDGLGGPRRTPWRAYQILPTSLPEAGPTPAGRRQVTCGWLLLTGPVTADCSANGACRLALY